MLRYKLILEHSIPHLLAETEPMYEEEFSRPPETLAAQLLSCVVVHGETAGMIVETEAYLGAGDLAAHASRGITKRTKILFGRAARAYVYFIYGMYECLNVVADQDGVPGCVLIRALAPLAGLSTMRERRAWSGLDRGLCNGPGKLTKALAIDRRHYGANLTSGELTIRKWKTRPAFETAIGPRIGIKECADWPLRFVWAGHECLSRKDL